MTKKTINVARVATSTALGLALAVGGTSVAFAHGAKDHASSNRHGHAIDGTIAGLTVSTPGSLTLTLRDGTSVTYTTTAATTYSEGHSTAAASALALGENVDVMLNATTPTNVDSVSIDLAKFEGKITAITGVAGAATITLSGPNNTTRTVTVDAATTFEMRGQTASFASLVVGAEIGAIGLSSSSNALTATSIRVSAPEGSKNVGSKNRHDSSNGQGHSVAVNASVGSMDQDDSSNGQGFSTNDAGRH